MDFPSLPCQDNIEQKYRSNIEMDYEDMGDMVEGFGLDQLGSPKRGNGGIKTYDRSHPDGCPDDE
jgi:hypothetical protein